MKKVFDFVIAAPLLLGVLVSSSVMGADGHDDELERALELSLNESAQRENNELNQVLELSLNNQNVDEDEEAMELERALQISLNNKQQEEKDELQKALDLSLNNNQNIIDEDAEDEEALLNRAVLFSFRDFEKAEVENLDYAIAEFLMEKELRAEQGDDFYGFETNEVAPVAGGLMGRIQQEQEYRRQQIEAQQAENPELNEKLKKRRDWEK